MRARIENGNIRLYRELPTSLKTDKGVLLNFNKASESVLEANGFFKVVKPSFNSKLQQKSGIYFNEELSVFTYDVTDLEFTEEQLSNVKKSLTLQTKIKCGELLKKTDWKVIRQIERGIEMSESDKQERLDILDECDRIVNDIELLDNYADAVNYNINFFPTEETEI